MQAVKQSARDSSVAASDQVLAFEYPGSGHARASQSYWDALQSGGESGEAEAEVSAAAVESALRAEFDGKLAEEGKRAFEAGRERGRLEERQAMRDALATAEQQRKRHAAELAETFSLERDRYLQAAEREVVQLALAVAARILRREAQMDPLLLTGAVRVALGQLSANTRVTLRVPPGELDLWTEAMVLIPNLAQRPVVVPGEGMRLGDCAIDTELGSVDLGILAQLAEIERGFFDRAGARSGPRNQVAAGTTGAVRTSGSAEHRDAENRS